MKNNTFFLVLILSIFFQMACSHSPTSSDEATIDDFADLELAEENDERDELQKDAVAELKSQQKDDLKLDLALLNDQLAAVEAKLALSKARLNHYRFVDSPAKETIKSATQSEVLSYEKQKSLLISRQNQLKSQITEE
ncbi:MAG: hypothetical protein ACK5P5_04620 [Pseudobdellovibrionaceae bacterium]